MVLIPHAPSTRRSAAGQQHLALIGLADLFLDGLPYNAHTTASDALWAGVPVLTQIGTAFPGEVRRQPAQRPRTCPIW